MLLVPGEREKANKRAGFDAGEGPAPPPSLSTAYGVARENLRWTALVCYSQREGARSAISTPIVGDGQPCSLILLHQRDQTLLLLRTPYSAPQNGIFLLAGTEYLAAADGFPVTLTPYSAPRAKRKKGDVQDPVRAALPLCSSSLPKAERNTYEVRVAGWSVSFAIRVLPLFFLLT